MVIYDDKIEGRSIIRLGSTDVEVDHMIPIKKTKHVIDDWIGPRLSKTYEYWPLLFEKAIIKYIYNSTSDIKQFTTLRRISNNIPLLGYNYFDIHGGFPRWVFNILFGVNIQSIPTSLMTNYCEIFDRQDCLACACTSSEFTDDHKSEGFVYGHAYSIISVCSDKKLIRVRNPWGKYESSEIDDGVDDGSFFISEKKFKEKFKVVCYLYVNMA